MSMLSKLLRWLTGCISSKGAERSSVTDQHRATEERDELPPPYSPPPYCTVIEDDVHPMPAADDILGPGPAQVMAQSSKCPSDDHEQSDDWTTLLRRCNVDLDSHKQLRALQPKLQSITVERLITIWEPHTNVANLNEELRTLQPKLQPIPAQSLITILELYRKLHANDASLNEALQTLQPNLQSITAESLIIILKLYKNDSYRNDALQFLRPNPQSIIAESLIIILKLYKNDSYRNEALQILQPNLQSVKVESLAVIPKLYSPHNASYCNEALRILQQCVL